MVFKWIIFSSSPSLAQTATDFNNKPEINAKNPAHQALDTEAGRIIALMRAQQKEKILEVINKVDEAIDKIISIPDNERKRYAVLISLAAKKYDIDPRIMISILKVESDFRQHAVSHTGDYSVAQINFKVWSRNFNKMDRAPLKYEKLIEDEAYSIFRMAEILNILQKQHAKTDVHWFARYHSSTPKFKNIYIKKLQVPLKKLVPFGPNMLDGLPDNPKQVAEICLGEKHRIKGL